MSTNLVHVIRKILASFLVTWKYFNEEIDNKFDFKVLKEYSYALKIFE